MQMTLEDRLVILWQERFYDAIACGYSEDAAEAYATKAVNSARNARRVLRSSK